MNKGHKLPYVYRYYFVITSNSSRVAIRVVDLQKIFKNLLGTQ